MVKSSFYSTKRYNTVRECLEEQFEKYDVNGCLYLFGKDGSCCDFDLFDTSLGHNYATNEEMIVIAEEQYNKYGEVFFTVICRVFDCDYSPSLVIGCVDENAFLSTAFLRKKKEGYRKFLERNKEKLDKIPRLREKIESFDFTDHIFMRRMYEEQSFCGCVVSEQKDEAIIKVPNFCLGDCLYEHAFVGNIYVNQYEQLLNGEYSGQRFVWWGLFADLVNGKNMWIETAKIYGEEYDDEKFHYKHFGYVINHDKKEYVEIPEIDDDEVVVHPLPLLCADGNGYGKNDYFGTNMELVGSWAYDHISVSNEKPDEEYTLLDIKFESFLRYVFVDGVFERTAWPDCLNTISDGDDDNDDDDDDDRQADCTERAGLHT